MVPKTYALGAASALVIGVGAMGVGSWATRHGEAPPPVGGSAVQVDVPDVSTIELASVDLPLGGDEVGADHRKGPRHHLLRALHAEWVTMGKDGPVTHQAIRGDVTAVSPTSITVKAKDGVSLTFTIDTDTKVRERKAGKGADSAIGDVTVGAKALVAGVGATAPEARWVIFR